MQPCHRCAYEDETPHVCCIYGGPNTRGGAGYEVVGAGVVEVNVEDAGVHYCRGDSAGGDEGVEAPGEGDLLGGDVCLGELGAQDRAGDTDGGGLPGRDGVGGTGVGEVGR
jgi:hypothetical protein